MRAEDAAPQALSPAAAVAAAAADEQGLSSDVAGPAWGHSGFLYAFSFSKWNVFNSGPLAYTPFELGYDFGNGLRVQSGMDLFYYEGTDIHTDDKGVVSAPAKYSYEMNNWRTSLFYRVPFDMRLRPLAGISVNIVSGSRKLSRETNASGKDINADKSKIPAWGYTGLGLQVGVEFLLNQDWSLIASLRYDVTFNVVPSPWVKQLGVAVTF